MTAVCIVKELRQAVNFCCQNLKSISDSLALVIDSDKLLGPLMELDEEFRMIAGSLLRMKAPFQISGAIVIVFATGICRINLVQNGMLIMLFLIYSCHHFFEFWS